MGKDNTWNLFFLMALGVAMGQSWNILGGFAGQTSLGHAAFFGIGALIARVLWFQGVPFVLAFLVAGMAAVTFAMIIGAPTFRLRGAYFAIGTLAVAEVLRITISQNQPYISTMSGKMIASYNLPLRYWVTLGPRDSHLHGGLPAPALALESRHPGCPRGRRGGPGHRGARSPAQTARSWC